MKSNSHFDFHFFTDSDRFQSYTASNNCIRLTFYTVQVSKLSLLYEIFECQNGYELSLQTEVATEID